MTRIFSKILIITFIIFFCVLAYFSFVGFETKRFNNQIQENLFRIDKKINIKLNDVKIKLDLFKLKINTKTIGPVISYNNKTIDIELIKSDISVFSLLNDEFSLSNLFISTKSVKLKDVISFYRSINNKNKAELFILENFIRKGYLIADINLNFDKQGKIKDDLKIKGLVRNGALNLIDKESIDKINLFFEIKNKDLDISDLKFSFKKINFYSEKIKLRNKTNFVKVEGKINNNKVTLSEESLRNTLNPTLNLALKNLAFSSENSFFFKLSDTLKILDYEIKSSLDIIDLSIRNDLNLSNIFPNLVSQVNFKNHQTEIIFKKENFSIIGKGDFLIQKNYDKAYYKIEKKRDGLFFDIKLNFINNPININFLNYKSNSEIESSLELDGILLKDKTLNLKNIEFRSGNDLILLNGLELNNSLKISNLKTGNFNFSDTQNIKNIFKIYKNKNDYIVSGKVINASKLIDDLIFENSKNRSFAYKDDIFKFDINEVYLDEDYIVYDLTGNLRFKNKNVISADIVSEFNDKEKIDFKIISNEDQKITTFFSDKAAPFVKKFDFIKGFEKGSLDFYSIKSENLSNSKLKIYNFSLKELPALTKILTLASLQGIADLLSGDGISFSEFEMNFENKDKIMNINEIYAIGPAISILMEGYIEKNNLISLRGTLVPATTINKVIGSIPILGDILVGKKTGEGVFGVSFKIKGPPKKLVTTVNPVKTLTPRFITRTLERIKKN